MFEKKNLALTDQDKPKNWSDQKLRRWQSFFQNHYYSEHFGEMTSGTKLFKMKKDHVWKKEFSFNGPR